MTKQQAELRAILFDYGGVLAEEGFHNGLVALAREQGLDITTIVKEATKAVYDSGFVLAQGTAADFWSLMRERTGLMGEDEVLTERILSGFILRAWMMESVRQLREQGYITGILSDQTYWLDTLNEKDPFYDAFDVVFNSYYRGKGKQDPSLYNDIATELGLPLVEILFIDDDEGNVNRARSVGMHAIQYVDKESFIQQLKQLK